MRLQIIASLVSWNSKAVGSAPDQTATFPEKSIVRFLAVVVRDCCWLYIFACYNRLSLVGGLVICKMDLVR